MQDNKKCIADLHNLPKETFRKIMREVSKAKAVDFNAKKGAVCPVCGAERCKVTTKYGLVRKRPREVSQVRKMRTLFQEC